MPIEQTTLDVYKRQDLDTLKQIAQDVAAMMQETEGLTAVDDGLSDASMETRIVVDKNKAAEYGLTTAQVYHCLLYTST